MICKPFYLVIFAYSFFLVVKRADLCLLGTFTPYRIPVNVIIPSGNATDNLFGPAELDFPQPPSRPKIVMTFPERPPISGLVEITVTHDETRPRGISLEIQGAIDGGLGRLAAPQLLRHGNKRAKCRLT